MIDGQNSKLRGAARSVGLLALTIAVVGCSDCGEKLDSNAATGVEYKTVERIPSPVPPVNRGEDGFLYAQVTKRPGPVPERFAARLPISVKEFDGDWADFPPRRQASAALCAGDPGMFERWVRAVSTAADAGPIGEDLAMRFAGMAMYCEKEPFCSLALRRLDTAQAGVSPVLLKSLTDCNGPEVLAAIEAGSSDAAVIDWYFAGYGKRFERLTDRFKQAAQAIVKSKKGRELRTLGVVLGRFDDPQTIAFTQQLEAGLDAESRSWLGIGMREHPSPEAKVLHAQACEHATVARDPMCGSGNVTFLGDKPPRMPETLAEHVRDIEFKAAEWLAAHPSRRDDLLSELQRCAQSEDGREWQRANCMRTFATLDRKSATAFVAQLQPDEGLPNDLRALKATLAKFPSDQALDDALVKWGLMPADPTPSHSEYAPAAPVTAYDRLLAAGRIHAFDVETGEFPNEHDALMKQLAAYAGTDLADVVFEEVPPHTLETNDTVQEAGPYLLRAYARGQVLEAQAANNGDWYDLEAVLGLLNVTARELGSEIRYAVADTDGQLAMVLGAPRASIAKAAQAGVLNLRDATEAMRLGKGFEQMVREKLERGEPLGQEVHVPAKWGRPGRAAGFTTRSDMSGPKSAVRSSRDRTPSSNRTEGRHDVVRQQPEEGSKRRTQRSLGRSGSHRTSLERPGSVRCGGRTRRAGVEALPALSRRGSAHRRLTATRCRGVDAGRGGRQSDRCLQAAWRAGARACV